MDGWIELGDFYGLSKVILLTLFRFTVMKREADVITLQRRE